MAPVKAGTEETIRAAWAELLGLDGWGSGERIVRESDTGTVSFVRVLGQGFLSGPAWALDSAAGLGDDELTLLPVLMGLAAGHNPRPLGAAELSYADAPVEVADLPVSRDDAHVAALESACSAEDTAEVGLGEMPHRWVVLDSPADAPDGAVPLAGTGYVVWADSLAHMGVLTSPHARGRGYGLLAGAVGTNAALAADLVPQWRARWDNEPSKRISEVLGYELAGSQTTMFVDQG